MIRPRFYTCRELWSVEEDNRMLRMKREGRTNLQIAAVLQRSIASIKGRLCTRWRNRAVKPRPKPLPIVFIDKSEVEAWYLLGWRMVAINGNMITAQWQMRSLPRFPKNRDAA